MVVKSCYKNNNKDFERWYIYFEKGKLVKVTAKSI